jgi:WD40 repeat protein
MPANAGAVIQGRAIFKCAGGAYMKLSPEGDRIALVPVRGGVEIRTIAGQNTVTQLEKPPAGALGFDWSPDGRYLAVHGVPPEGLRVHDVQSRRELWSKGLGSVGNWSPDGKLILTSDIRNQTGLLIDARTGSVIQTIPGAWSRQWAPGSQHALAQYIVNKPPGLIFKILETNNWTPVVEIDNRVREGAAIAWSPDSKLIAFGGDYPVFGPHRGTWIVDAATGKVVHKLSQYITQVRAIAWSRKGDLVAITCGTRESDGRMDVVNVHSAASGQVIYRLVGPQTHIMDLHWAASGSRIRAAGGDGSRISVWEWVLAPTPTVQPGAPTGSR